MADVAMVLADVGLGVLLFFLLAPVDRTLSMLAMAFRLAQAAVLGLSLVNLHQASSLAHTTTLDTASRDALVTSLLDSHAAGYDMGLFFFAINSVLVGLLLYRSGFVPRLMGAGLAASGIVYLVGSALPFAAPDLAGVVAPAYVLPLVSELAFAGWLVSRANEARLTRASGTAYQTRELAIERDGAGLLGHGGRPLYCVLWIDDDSD